MPAHAAPGTTESGESELRPIKEHTMNNTPTLHPADASAQPAPARAPSRRVTDAPTRMFHWLFALCFAGAYATADGEHWRLKKLKKYSTKLPK